MSKASNKRKIYEQHQRKLVRSARAKQSSTKQRSLARQLSQTATVPKYRITHKPDISITKPFYRSHPRAAISEISREATAGGVIYRFGATGLEVLLVADHFDRWTIPKGHIEAGETAQETAIREIGEEAGVHKLDPVCWLGKIHFRYRRDNVLVLMSTQIYLFKALGDTNDIKKEDWMNGIKWFPYQEAVSIIAYKDIAKLMRLGYRRLAQKGEIDG